MRLRLREKQNFYYELGRLLRSGSSFTKVVETLSHDARGNLRRFMERLREAAGRGDSIAEALEKQRPTVSDLEVSIVSACERSGRIDQGCEQLSEYFGTLARSRAVVLQRLTYPAFILHFGVFILALPKFLIGGSTRDYLKQTVGVLLVLYCAVAIVALVVSQLNRLGRTNPALDRLLRALPGFGKVRRCYSLARFCATYEAHLQAGVNVMESLTTAGKSSQSALIAGAVRKGLPEIRGGSQVAPLLAKSSAFPAQMIRALRLGEETGELDQELKRLTGTFEKEALARVETLSEWLPKIIYLAIMLYIAWQIVGVYQGMLSGYEKVLDL